MFIYTCKKLRNFYYLFGKYCTEDKGIGDMKTDDVVLHNANIP